MSAGKDFFKISQVVSPTPVVLVLSCREGHWGGAESLGCHVAGACVPEAAAEPAPCCSNSRTLALYSEIPEGRRG